MNARILIIEDNPGNLELMVYLLEAFGYLPQTATDGEQGVVAALAERPDLIVCDVHLPRMDGYGVIRALKSRPELRQTPVVAVTALAMVGDRERLLSAGFDGYISKPIDPETFIPQVESFLAHNLHAAPEPVPPEPAPARPEIPAARRGRILSVNDSPNNQELIRGILEPFGYRVVSANSVAEALDRLTGDRFDLILSDLWMPRVDGWGFLKTVRGDPRWRDIPFVFLSASVWGGNEQALALSLGATRYLHSPIEPLALLREIEDCLDGTPQPQGEAHGDDPGR